MNDEPTDFHKTKHIAEKAIKTNFQVASLAYLSFIAEENKIPFSRIQRKHIVKMQKTERDHPFITQESDVDKKLRPFLNQNGTKHRG